MKTLTGTGWKRKGSSILFDQIEIQKLLDEKVMFSLREFLSWKDDMPEEPPVDGDTILICGLETIMDSLPAEDAEDFLRCKIRPVIKALNNVWTETALVFGFPGGRERFEETPGMREEVLFLRSDDEKVHISEGLWDGTAELNMQRLEVTFMENRTMIPIGYYVQRIS